MEKRQDIIWVSGGPGYGKTTLARSLYGTKFSTDHFVMDIKQWCQDEEMIEKWEKQGRHGQIGAFLDWNVESGRSELIAHKLFDKIRERANTIGRVIVEGYMPIEIQDAVMMNLEAAGYNVWIVIRREQFHYCNPRLGNWRKPRSLE